MAILTVFSRLSRCRRGLAGAWTRGSASLPWEMEFGYCLLILFFLVRREIRPPVARRVGDAGAGQQDKAAQRRELPDRNLKGQGPSEGLLVDYKDQQAAQREAQRQSANTAHDCDSHSFNRRCPGDLDARHAQGLECGQFAATFKHQADQGQSQARDRDRHADALQCVGDRKGLPENGEHFFAKPGVGAHADAWIGRGPAASDRFRINARFQVGGQIDGVLVVEPFDQILAPHDEVAAFAGIIGEHSDDCEPPIA